MAETNSLLNCRTRKGTGGSNPPFSAEEQKTADWRSFCLHGVLEVLTTRYSGCYPGCICLLRPGVQPERQRALHKEE